MTPTKKIAAVAIALIAPALVACQSGGGAASPAAPAGSPAGSAPASAPAKQLNITFVQGVIGDNFYITMECGMRDAVAKAGNIKLDVQGPQTWDASLQQPIVTAVVAKKPDALLIAPNDVQAMQAPLKNAADAGIKVGLVDTTVNDPSFAFTQISSDNEGGGKAAFEALKKLLPDGGQVMVIDHTPGISTTDARTKGFEEAVKADSKFEYVGKQYAQNDPAKAAGFVTSMYQKYPNLKGIFATNLFSATGAATGIRQANAVGKIKVVAFDAGPDQVKALQEDTVQALVAQKPFDIGSQAIAQAIKAVNGEATTPTIQTGSTIITKDMLGTPAGDQAVYLSKC